MVELAKINTTVKFTKGSDPKPESSLIEEEPKKTIIENTSPSNPRQQNNRNENRLRDEQKQIEPQRKAQNRSVKKTLLTEQNWDSPQRHQILRDKNDRIF